MTSTFFGLDLALRALHAQQTGLDVTNHNVANANTKGFSRQRVNIVATTPFSEPGLNRAGGPGQIGTGSIADSIERFRDTFLDLQYRTEVGAGAQAQVTRDALEQIEVVLNEPSDTGIANLLQEFYQSWQDLTNDPTEGANRSAVVQQATALAAAFNRASQRMSAIQLDLNGQVAIGVQEINSIVGQIDALNRQIVQVEVTGQNANDHRDRRDALLDELSQKVPITAVENANGSINVSINGHNLVSPGNVDSLITTPTGPGGMLQIRFGSDSVLTSVTTGELKGLIDTRDINLPSYVAQLNTVAANMITAVNALHTTGYGLDNVTGRAFFTGTDAATIAVNAVIVADPQRVAAAAAANQPGDSSIALAIAQLRTTMTPSSESSYAALITTLGVDTRSTQDKATNQDALVQLLERRREDVSGISLDEEATNMVRFQRAYEAAARLMTAFDQMLDTLINRTGIVGR
ncbi:MAG: flagellar hook-associated protein FlgK [Chloroflexota bacterium]